MGEAVAGATCVLCHRCGEAHALISSTDYDTGEPTSLLLGYVCEGVTYIAAVAGKLLPGIRVAACPPPAPGSDAARAQGCRCPVMDNGRGHRRQDGDGKQIIRKGRKT